MCASEASCTSALGWKGRGNTAAMDVTGRVGALGFRRCKFKMFAATVQSAASEGVCSSRLDSWQRPTCPCGHCAARHGAVYPFSHTKAAHGP
jgi:hypothetical protein